ncbi:MAG: addiction module protein [Planctomycetota bacterium]
MSKTPPITQILKLSVAERIQIVEDVWDSIASEANEVFLTANQKRELDRRLSDQRARPGVGKPWKEVKKRLSKPK